MSLTSIFSKQILRSGFVKKPKYGYFGSSVAKYSKIWEPDYLILGTTKTPEYDLINVQIKGYDFAVLEKFQRLILKIAESMNVNVCKKWAAPQQDLHIQHFKVNSSIVLYDYQMRVSERNIQVADVQSHIMPLFIDAVLTSCPPGVNVSFHEHEEYMEESRYIPNQMIKELEAEMADIGIKKKKKK